MTYKSDSIHDSNCYDFVIDSAGNFWITSYTGLLKYDRNEVRVYTTANGLPTNVIWGVENALSGQLWVAGEEGVSLFDNDTSLINYAQEDGLEMTNVWDISYSPSNVLFSETDDGGIYYLDSAEWKTFRAADGGFRRYIAFRDDILWYTHSYWESGYGNRKLLVCTSPLTIYQLPWEFYLDQLIPLLVDSENDLWLCTTGSCTAFSPPSNWTTFSMSWL